MFAAAVLYTGVLIGTILLGYFVLGGLAYLFYDPERADRPAEHVRFAIVTVGSYDVERSLVDCIDHHREMFADHQLYVVTDEGADLEDELRAVADVTTVVVPDDFVCDAKAKGRAIQYFIEDVVADAPGYWYGFIDDDNLVLDDDFLYEIPAHEDNYGAMNSVLVPRRGRSSLTYVMDHVRWLDDLTVFRAFTGLLGRPYIGFHGELLTARGDVLLDVGFDRESIVEDYAFATRLIEEDVRTWQSRTRVSILSPNSLVDLLRQRSRWFIGILNLLHRTSPVTKVAASVRMLSWILALVAGPMATVVWHTEWAVAIPPSMRVAPFLAGAVYGGTYLYGAWRIGGWRRLPFALAIPLCVLVEASSPLYAVFVSDGEFTVIDKS
jgi:cellulose synthase/poly-beta-1,6-N-acetylglucosamine synthase-like glycosyltransferase